VLPHNVYCYFGGLVDARHFVVVEIGLFYAALLMVMASFTKASSSNSLSSG